MVMNLLAVPDTFDTAIRAWGEHQSWPIEQILRLLLAAVAGALVGIEREMRGRQAGFRTNLLVCVGSALVMIVSINFGARSWPHDGSFNLNVDPGRIAYGIMTGVGFLGAGTIIKHGATVRGLTTAASLWCVAGVGLAAGFGMYTVTAVATVIIVAALWILGYLDEALPKPYYRMITIRRQWKPGAIDQTVERIKSAGLTCHTVNFDRIHNPSQVDISVLVSFKDKKTYYRFATSLENDAEYQLVASQED
jgi:putative Mg2+ transporter-C (MgtC) family protein